MKEKLKQTKGITLIALVITIIDLLILAGVSIAILTGQNGILTQANNAKIEQAHGSVREGIALAYNEYQIEINTASNTKLASTETVTIQGKEERILANTYSSFLDFLVQKGYATLDEEDATIGIINVKALTGSSQALGNGMDTDVYKIEEENGMYVVNYYDKDNQKEEIWSIVNNDNEGDGSKYSVESIQGVFGLKDLENDSFTTFTNAYVNYNGELVDISEYIVNYEGISAINSWNISELIGFENNTMKEVVLIKDGKEYRGEVLMHWAA